MQIEKIIGREILDSRGIPTLEASLILKGGFKGRAGVPSGASTGQFEALELRDGDPGRFSGCGVLQALHNLNQVIAPAVQGCSYPTQAAFDGALRCLDGTPNKTHLGANAILAASLAFARARARQMACPLYQSLGEATLFQLPVPMINLVNGGVHADNPLSIQEFMIVPHGFDTFSLALRAGAEIIATLKTLLKGRGLSTNVGDEGGFAPFLRGTREALDLICEAVQKTGYSLGSQVALALDVAASELIVDGLYHLAEENLSLTADQLVLYYDKLIHDYPLISIEDGFGDVDKAGWKLMTEAFGGEIQLVGDDLFVTNSTRLHQGIESGLANAVLIKVNQVGSLTESMETIEVAKEAGYHCIISHRSGETEDTFIADLAVGRGVGQIKTGSLMRSERVAKYNQLLRIEQGSNGTIPFAGSRSFALPVIERVLS